MKLTCDDFLKFIDPYVDGEFDERESLECDLHLESCDSCRHIVEHHSCLQHQFKEVLHVGAAPEALRESILCALRQEVSQTSPPPLPSPPLKERLRRSGMVAAPLAAACTLFLRLPGFRIAPVSGDTPPAIEQSLEWHRGAYPLEIQSPDTAHVSQWFHGKVDFPVRLAPVF